MKTQFIILFFVVLNATSAATLIRRSSEGGVREYEWVDIPVIDITDYCGRLANLTYGPTSFGFQRICLLEATPPNAVERKYLSEPIEFIWEAKGKRVIEVIYGTKSTIWNILGGGPIDETEWYERRATMIMLLMELENKVETLAKEYENNSGGTDRGQIFASLGEYFFSLDALMEFFGQRGELGRFNLLISKMENGQRRRAGSIIIGIHQKISSLVTVAGYRREAEVNLFWQAINRNSNARVPLSTLPLHKRFFTLISGSLRMNDDGLGVSEMSPAFWFEGFIGRYRAMRDLSDPSPSRIDLENICEILLTQPAGTKQVGVTKGWQTRQSTKP